MKINRFIALAVIALLVVGVLGAFSSKVFASGNHTLVAQSGGCAPDQADSTESADAPDTDKADLQCGDQNEADRQDAVDAPDTDKVNEQSDPQDAPDNETEVQDTGSTVTP